MFKLVIFILVLVLLVIFLIKRYYFYKLYLQDDVIKYKLNTRDKLFFKKTPCKIDSPGIKLFYTNVKWNSRTNNNYILDTVTDNYCIIEPGYYYSLHKNCKLFFDNPFDIYDFDYK